MTVAKAFEPRNQARPAKWIVPALMLAALFWWAPAPALAGHSVLWLTPGQDRFALASRMEYFEDPGGSLSIDQASSPAWAGRFRPPGGDTLNLGVTRSEFWFRFDLGRREGEPEPQTFLLDLGQPFLTFATLYRAVAAEDGSKIWREFHPLDRAGRPVQQPGRFLHFQLALA